MKFSRNWLAEYVELPSNVEELADSLTAAGLAVETVESVADDAHLEIEVTTNRADCMSHLGLAREVAAAFDRSIEWPEAATPGAVKIDSNQWGSIALEDEIGCPRYVGIIVRGVTVGPSPDWLCRRLEAVGVRPINNVVDITNFVLWEYGQPLHAFDADTLAGPGIVVRSARAGEKLTTLDGVERTLDPELLVIADRDRAVAIAGVMGGLETEVGESTKNVLIESAHFNPSRVRTGAKKLGIHTDASHRFERGADSEGCLEAALRAARLVCELGGGQMEPEVIDARAGMAEPLRGQFSLAELNRFCGLEFDQVFVTSRLEKLGFVLSPQDGDEAGWAVEVPSWRRYDFETDANGMVYPAYFYEEVLRLRGFDDVPATLPRIEGPDAGSGTTHRRRERLRTSLAAAGLAETITYAFGSADDAGRFENLVDGPSLRLANGLSEQFDHMRRSLLPGLVEGALFNLRREASAVGLYEIGHVFPAQGDEVDALAVVLGGTVGSPWQRNHAADFFDLKGIIEATAIGAGSSLEFKPAEVKGFVSGSGAEILDRSSGLRLGYAGRVDVDTAVDLYAAELACAGLGRTSGDQVVAPSKHPGVSVDLTLTHSVGTAWSEIASAIRALDVEDLTHFEMRDRYSGEGVPDNAVNTTIGFRYNADDRSLTQEEVNDRQGRLVQTLESKFSLSG